MHINMDSWLPILYGVSQDITIIIYFDSHLVPELSCVDPQAGFYEYLTYSYLSLSTVLFSGIK